jgi:chemotaxis signal transduction protein
MQIAVVEINNREFGLPINFLFTILKAGAIYQVPLSTPEKLGLINFQGEILTVFHPGVIIDMKAPVIGQDNVILILKIEKQQETWKVGILVEKVIDILQISESDIFDIPEESSVNKNIINKKIQKENRHIWLINLDKLLSTNETELSNVRL